MREDPDAVNRHVPLRPCYRRRKILSRNHFESVLKLSAAGDNIAVFGIRPNSRRITATVTSKPEIRFRGEAPYGTVLYLKSADAEKAAAFVVRGKLFLEQRHVSMERSHPIQRIASRHLPETAAFLEQIAATFGTRKFPYTFRKLYPKCENISIDYAVLERRSAKGEAQGSYLSARGFSMGTILGSWTALLRASHCQELRRLRQHYR